MDMSATLAAQLSVAKMGVHAVTCTSTSELQKGWRQPCLEVDHLEQFLRGRLSLHGCRNLSLLSPNAYY